MSGDSNSFNAKQQGEFKQLLKQLDAKEYKKGLKNAENLLKQVPNNADVQALKAIFIFHTENQEEGAALAKAALYKNLKSELCWQIYGLIHKEQKNYIETVKCFLQTLNKTPQNLNLMRDTCNLQLHCRDFDGHYQLRYKLLKEKPGMVVNWMGYLVGQHLTGQVDQFFNTIASIEKLIEKDSKLKGVEINEFKLYQIQLATEMGDLKRAQQQLIDFKDVITDQVSYNEFVFEVSSKLKLHKQAEEAVNQLIQLQPQNWKYYEMLLQLTPDNDLSMYPNNLVKSRVLAKTPLNQFFEAFKQFISPFFQKSLPSLFREIIHLYSDQAKIPLMKQAYEEYLKGDNPIEQLWAWFMLAQHQLKVGELDSAMEFIDKAINQTPTLQELYLVKAKIYKQKRDFQKAFESADQARQLDLADRYLNNKSIKYALRNNTIYLAYEYLRMFLRDSSNPYELQMIWFELGVAKAFLRLRYFGQGLSLLNQIFKQHQEMYDDQMDFYQYCLRKYTIRSLLQMMDAMDNRFNNKRYIEAAGLMIWGLEQYSITLKEQKNVVQKKLTPNEKKKLAKQQQQKEKEQHIREQFNIEGHIFGLDLQKKYDLSGQQLLSTLQTDENIIKLQQQVATTLIHTQFNNKEINFKAFKQLVGFYIKTKRPLLLLKVLNKLRANETDSNRNLNHKYQLQAMHYLESYDGEHKPLVKEYLQPLQEFDLKFWSTNQPKSQLDQIIKQQCELILKGTNPDSINIPETDDLDILEEYPQARLTTKNKLYIYDPNLEWQNKQVENLQQHQQDQQQQQQQQQ